MKRNLFLLLAPVVAALWLVGSPVRAEFIVDWGYNWDRTPPVITAGTGGVTLTNEPAVTAAGSSDVVATNLRTFSEAVSNHPDTISNGNYTLSVKITDTNTGVSGVLAFTGFLSGSFSKDSANVKNTFTGLLSKQLNLGGDVFTVSMISYSPPGPPTATNAGSIGAHVDVAAGSGGNNGGGGNHAPEPSCLVLAGMGLSFLGLGGYRRWLRRNG
jgi:hypothetical protein